MNERVAIVGVRWAGFRPSTPEASYKEMIYEAAVRAYNDAGVDPRKDIESFVTVAEDFHEGTSIFDEYTPDQLAAAMKSMHTITGDGLHGLATAVMLIKTGQFSVVALEGHSKASNILTLAAITRANEGLYRGRDEQRGRGAQQRRRPHRAGAAAHLLDRVAGRN